MVVVGADVHKRGIEGCRNQSARLERDLRTAGHQPARVPPKSTGQTRASTRTRGKSDPIDALAAGRAARGRPELPVTSHDDVSLELNLSVDRREVLVAQRIGECIRTVASAALNLSGCREPTTDRRVGEAAGVTRFKGDWVFGRHGGVAPIPVWSGRTAGGVRMIFHDMHSGQQHRHRPEQPAAA